MTEQQNPATLLLVDDDPLIAESLGFILKSQYQVVIADSRAKCTSLVNEMSSFPELALIDLGLPPFPHKPDEGFAIIKELLARDENIKILVLSGQDNDMNIQHALTIGAVDFIAKPADPALLLSRLQHHQKIQEIEKSVEQQANVSEIIGNSAAIETIRNQIQQFSESPFPVLVQGESGTGKEMIAKELHQKSSRSKLPYFVLNCAAIAPDLLEAQLFGHRKGAFTGAEREHKGFFIEVGAGTLFLDEIGELPINLQGKLLRVLENGEFYRLGETKQYISKARIIAATNKKLSREVANGRFRADLYHRLSILNITMPPLRKREADSHLFIEHFQNIYSKSVAPFTLDEDATKVWNQYDFPGNVRELRNIVIRLGTKYPGNIVTAEQLEDELETHLSVNNLQDDQLELSDEKIKKLLGEGKLNLDEMLLSMESRCIRLALEKYNNNLSKAAAGLKINRTTLYSRVQKLTGNKE